MLFLRFFHGRRINVIFNVKISPNGVKSSNKYFYKHFCPYVQNNELKILKSMSHLLKSINTHAHSKKGNIDYKKFFSFNQTSNWVNCTCFSGNMVFLGIKLFIRCTNFGEFSSWPLSSDTFLRKKVMHAIMEKELKHMFSCARWPKTDKQC